MHNKNKPQRNKKADMDLHKLWALAKNLLRRILDVNLLYPGLARVEISLIPIQMPLDTGCVVTAP